MTSSGRAGSAVGLERSIHLQFPLEPSDELLRLRQRLIPAPGLLQLGGQLLKHLGLLTAPSELGKDLLIEHVVDGGVALLVPTRFIFAYPEVMVEDELLRKPVAERHPIFCQDAVDLLQHALAL